MIVILGGGITGLAAANALIAAGEECLVLEKEAEAGGHCRSIVAGRYAFDMSGHFLHSSDPATLDWILRLPGIAWKEVSRDARVWLRGKLTPYPFQANLKGHDPGFVKRCLAGFAAERIREAVKGEAPCTNFAQWLKGRFGKEMCRSFFFPFNRKMWRTPLEKMGIEWTAWSVPVPRFEDLLAGARGETREGMGYNAAFRYPCRGGIGSLPRALAHPLGNRVRAGLRVVRVDLRRSVVRTSDGREIFFRAAISTIPLPELAGRCDGLSAGARAAAKSLKWVKVLAINLGVAGGPPPPGHWIYVPERAYTFFRTGFLSNVDRSAAPEGGASIFVEKSFLPGAAVRVEDEVSAALSGLRRMGILHRGSVVEERREVMLDPAYVIFDRSRGKAVSLLTQEFWRRGVILAGRYGSWDYYGMERSMADGMRAAREAVAVRG
ncbi:MAG: FAD-dependent oxidoreductase [Deltaproteobacteria bacterium]|nr:FAD-dependent oxidoreductase [Deltaproteobacteria bacterium]